VLLVQWVHPTGTGRRRGGERDPLSLSRWPTPPCSRRLRNPPRNALLILAGTGSRNSLGDALLAAETSAQHHDESERQADGRQEVRVRIWGLQAQLRRRRLHHAHVAVCTYALCTHLALAPTAAHIYRLLFAKLIFYFFWPTKQTTTRMRLAYGHTRCGPTGWRKIRV